MITSRGGRRRGLVAALLACLALGGLQTAAVADGVAQLDAVAVFAEDCDGRAGDFTLAFVEGDLIGCWYITVGAVHVTPSGAVVETGTEEFVGCLHTDGAEVCGAFTTTYRFTGRFEEDGTELFGRCQHPIVGGTGGFDGITGRIDIKDDVVGGTFVARGHVDLGD